MTKDDTQALAQLSPLAALIAKTEGGSAFAPRPFAMPATYRDSGYSGGFDDTITTSGNDGRAAVDLPKSAYDAHQLRAAGFSGPGVDQLAGRIPKAGTQSNILDLAGGKLPDSK
jgi:hypothetical protein